MKTIVCISGSNIKHAQENSTSLKVCKLIEIILHRDISREISVQIIPLVKFELKPCIGCGKCYKLNKCVNDNNFNNIYETLCNADAFFIVAAHYAPIPSKLAMLLEKVEQISFLKRFNQENYRSPLYQKPVGIIGHGGGTEEIHKLYLTSVNDNIWNALSYPVEMNIIGVDSEQPRGTTFPVKEVKRNYKSVFPIQEYDWNDIETRITPLINKIINQILH
jgi:multimeric flavodoxin WrbA